MPRRQGTSEPIASLIGRLILLLTNERQTTASLALELRVSERQVNRYLQQLNEAGWSIRRVGPNRLNCRLESVHPRVERIGDGRD